MSKIIQFLTEREVVGPGHPGFKSNRGSKTSAIAEVIRFYEISDMPILAYGFKNLLPQYFILPILVDFGGVLKTKTCNDCIYFRFFFSTLAVAIHCSNPSISQSPCLSN